MSTRHAVISISYSGAPFPAARIVHRPGQKNIVPGVFDFESTRGNGYTKDVATDPLYLHATDDQPRTLPMNQPKDNGNTQAYPGAVPMARIDGGAIRRLRESKGLTQLYLSTVVGVTTDTISRWENRRYQSIKLENAEKLAQALEIPLEDILDKHCAEEAPLAEEEKTAAGTPARGVSLKSWLLPAGAAIFLAAALLVLLLAKEQPRGTVTAERILPPHVPPGQTFPVLIRLHPAGPETVSLIIKETIPPGCKALGGSPAVTSLDARENTLKWIGRTEPDRPIHAYVCQVPAAASLGEKLFFNGAVTMKEGGGDQPIGGASSLIVAPFHWADTNRDNTIDDEEILSVYEQYVDTEGLDVDQDLIDSIWAGSGYAWDGEQKRYLVLD